MGKSDNIHMRADPELKELLREEAKRRSTDISGLVTQVMWAWLEKNAGAVLSDDEKPR